MMPRPSTSPRWRAPHIGLLLEPHTGDAPFRLVAVHANVGLGPGRADGPGSRTWPAVAAPQSLRVRCGISRGKIEELARTLDRQEMQVPIFGQSRSRMCNSTALHRWEGKQSAVSMD